MKKNKQQKDKVMVEYNQEEPKGCLLNIIKSFNI